MDPAFLVGVLLPPPAACPLGLAREHRARARRAADRLVPVVEELGVQDLVIADVVPHAVERPVGKRVELDDATVLTVELDLGDVPAADPLLTPEAGDPGVERRQLAFERLDLADRAAGRAEIDAPVHRVRAVRRLERGDGVAIRHLELDVDAVAIADLFEQGRRLGRKAARAEREHADARVDPPGHVDERHAVDAACGADREARVEGLDRPSKQVLRAGVLEPIGRVLDPRRLLVDHSERRFVDRLDRVSVCHRFLGPVGGRVAPHTERPPARRPWVVLDGCAATAGGGVRASPCPRRCDSTGATAPWPRLARQRVSGSLGLHRQCARLAGAIGYRRRSRHVKDGSCGLLPQSIWSPRRSHDTYTGTVAAWVHRPIPCPQTSPTSSPAGRRLCWPMKSSTACWPRGSWPLERAPVACASPRAASSIRISPKPRWNAPSCAMSDGQAEASRTPDCATRASRGRTWTACGRPGSTSLGPRSTTSCSSTADSTSRCSAPRAWTAFGSRDAGWRTPASSRRRSRPWCSRDVTFTR